MNYNDFKKLLETAMRLGFKTVAELYNFRDQHDIKTNRELLDMLENIELGSREMRRNAV